MDVVVVESPAKAKTINKYLGSGYKVLASFGHVRDLPRKDGSVRPDEDFAMDWEVDERAKKRLKDIADALKGAEHLYLATDPDREGEAISWHVYEALRGLRALGKVDVKRVVFHEVTKDAVLDAIRHPRDLHSELVEAYFARRALDYLVGFTLSPVLWRKVPGSKSAGRVQSVALRLICERESEIEAFKPQEYWTVDVDFLTPRHEKFSARLTHVDSKKLDKLDLSNEAKAKAAVAAIEAGRFSVADVQKKQTRRHPFPPFTTSTLQQEASRKLGLSASRTMRIAQQLYEGVDIGGDTVGLITYMRTDSVNLANEAIFAARGLIERQYGKRYLPDAPRLYKTKTRNAQEAHEAIRPTDIKRRPQDVHGKLDADQRRLYELIWRRTLACQMESAILDQVAVDIATGDKRTMLRANGSVIAFDGFLTLYQEDLDDPDESGEDRILPKMDTGEAVAREAIKPEQHFTQPPPRYTEASLVKKLEELGIGRPSTYASILQVLQDRDYVTLEKKRFIPSDRGRIVTAFLTNFFQRYVEYGFTADLEEQLDDISNGKIDWKAVLRQFWQNFAAAVDDTKDLTIRQVIDALDEALGPHFFPKAEGGKDPRVCPACGNGRLGLRFGKFGAFIGCSNYPGCKFTRRLGLNGHDEASAAAAAAGANGDGKKLGQDPVTGETVALKVGPYGPYVQLGENAPKPKKPRKSKKAKAEEGAAPDKDAAAATQEKKPKRVSLPKGIDPAALTLETALKLLALPREVGRHPESGKPIKAGIGRFGPYIQHEKMYKSLEEGDDVLSIGLNRAVVLLAQPGKGRRAAAAPLREVGPHPADGKTIGAGVGRYGPYVKHGKIYASLPRDRTVEDITLDEAVALIDAKAARGSAKRKGTNGAAAPEPAAADNEQKPAARKSPAKKKAAPRKSAAAPAGE
jgi:DNA topoisomerase-1